jgi:hypothetical protein
MDSKLESYKSDAGIQRGSSCERRGNGAGNSGYYSMKANGVNEREVPRLTLFARDNISSPEMLVRSSGFEPPRYCYRQPLKLVRLPVPPRPRRANPKRRGFGLSINEPTLLYQAYFWDGAGVGVVAGAEAGG